MILCVAVVVIFKGGVQIANAYGLTVITVMLMDTWLASLVMLVSFNWHAALPACFLLPLTAIEATYMSANLLKVPKGAWFSVGVATIISIITLTWTWGQRLKARHIQKEVRAVRDLLEEEDDHSTTEALLGSAATGDSSAPPNDDDDQPAEGSPPAPPSSAAAPTGPASGPQRLRLVSSGAALTRAPGIGIYYSEHHDGVPPVLARFLQKLPVLHEIAIFLTIRHTPIPTVAASERLLVRRLRFKGFFHVVARFGGCGYRGGGPQLN